MSNRTAFATVSPLPTVSDADSLGEKIMELCCYLSAAEARLLSLIREFDRKAYWAHAGFLSCAHWLNFKCGIGMNAAREKIRVARALADLPQISSAFEKGLLSYSKVRAMTRVASPDNEDYLMMIAKHGTAHHVEKLVAKYRHALRLQGAEPAAEARRRRELTWHYDDDGSLVIRARLPAEQGAVIVKALEMAMDRQFAEDVTAETSTDRDSFDVRRADALAEIAETYLDKPECSGSTADRYQVVLHVTAETSAIEDGPGVTAETSRRIACDSSMVAIREDPAGRALSIGRRSRTIPPPMRRALMARDRGCRFPGCTNTRFVDGHHIEHWADGGETSLDNLVMLCRRHHHLVHEGGFVCEKDARGKINFRDLRERPLPDFPEPVSQWSAAKFLQQLDREIFDLDIDSEGCAARWYAGERMNWNDAVSAMF